MESTRRSTFCHTQGAPSLTCPFLDRRQSLLPDRNPGSMGVYRWGRWWRHCLNLFPFVRIRITSNLGRRRDVSRDLRRCGPWLRVLRRFRPVNVLPTLCGQDLPRRLSRRLTTRAFHRLLLSIPLLLVFRQLEVLQASLCVHRRRPGCRVVEVLTKSLADLRRQGIQTENCPWERAADAGRRYARSPDFDSPRGGELVENKILGQYVTKHTGSNAAP